MLLASRVSVIRELVSGRKELCPIDCLSSAVIVFIDLIHVMIVDFYTCLEQYEMRLGMHNPANKRDSKANSCRFPPVCALSGLSLCEVTVDNLLCK